MRSPHRINPRLPAGTVRLRLTLLYSGLFLVSGLALLAATFLLYRHSTGVDLIVPSGAPRGSDSSGLRHVSAGPELRRQVDRMFQSAVARNRRSLHQGLAESAAALAIMAALSVALGWLVAGRVLRPLRTMTATTRQISERNLNARLALTGPRDELKDLADTVDGLLARLEAHVGEQQRFAANASHELRTPLAITRTLLDVARNDPAGVDGDLIERLREVNTRAIDLTEALLLLSRAEQRTVDSEELDLSLIAEEAAEMLLCVAERAGVTIATDGTPSLTAGSRALLLQMLINLVQNAIVHNRPAGGSVWVRTGTRGDRATLTVENTGEILSAEQVAKLHEPFQRGSERVRTDHAGVGLGLAIVARIVESHQGTLTLTPRKGGGLHATVELPGLD